MISGPVRWASLQDGESLVDDRRAMNLADESRTLQQLHQSRAISDDEFA